MLDKSFLAEHEGEQVTVVMVWPSQPIGLTVKGVLAWEETSWHVYDPETDNGVRFTPDQVYSYFAGEIELQLIKSEY